MNKMKVFVLVVLRGVILNSQPLKGGSLSLYEAAPLNYPGISKLPFDNIDDDKGDCFTI
jgi:hypothetical protein